MSEKVYGPGLGSGPRAVGIDQSYTGFGLTAMSGDGGFQTYVYKAPGKGIDRLLKIEDWLNIKLWELEGGGGIAEVAVEAPVLRSPSALLSGQLFAIVLRTLRYRVNDPEARYPVQVPPTTLKKYIAGKGNVDKNQVLLQTYKKWGVEFPDDNAADSYGLARIAAGLATNQVEQAVLDTLLDPKFRGL